MPHRCCLQGRRRDQRQQTCHLRQRLGRRLERDLDLGGRAAEIDRQARRARLEPVEQALDEEPVARLGWDSPRGGVRVRQQSEPLELGQLAADGGGRHPQARPFDEMLRADRLAG
jgi:uncharacterized protein (DUF3084 family)